MKKVLVLVIAVMLFMVMTPVALAAYASSGATVYVSVSVDGKLLVAAQPVTITDMTAQGAVKAAHEAYYSGGLSGYVAGIDPTFNMYLVTKCWGVQATPYIIINDAPLGATPGAPATVDVAPVAANDNIIICTSSDAMNKPATPVSLKSTLSGDSATVTATSWVLDFTTFTYSHSSLANAKVVDSAGASLGTTDANGSITLTAPANGIVAIDGLAAINVKAVPAASSTPTGTATPPQGTISYTDAKNYIGKTVTIQAQVFDKTDAGDFWVLYLGGPTTDPNAVGIEIKKSDVSKFPADMYVGKTIRMTGELHTNPVGGASFSLTDPSQIEVVSAAATTPASSTVYVSVSVDGQLLVAAKPVTPTVMTVDGALKAAHEAYYSGGLDGYAAGIDPAWNMFLISKCWGIKATPYVMVNGAPFNAPPNGLLTADTAPIVGNDNIIICTGTDMVNNPVQPVSLKSTLSGDSATVTATLWTLDFTTFQYSSAPLANADVLNSSSTSLGKTDADGKITVTIPADGIVIIKGLSAINVKAVSAPPTTTTTTTTPAGQDIPLMYGNTISLIIVGVVILTPIAVIVIVKMVRQSRLDKPAASSKKKQSKGESR